MSELSSSIPLYGTPIIDGNGNIADVWYRFFVTLLQRTGGLEGFDAETVLRNISFLLRGLADEEAARSGQVPAWRVGKDPDPLAIALQRMVFDQPPDRLHVDRKPSDPLLDLVQVMRRPQDAFPEMVYSHGRQDGGDLHAVATAQANGFMSAADKAGFDAQAAYLANSVSITSDIVQSNSTAEVQFLTVNYGANQLQAGSTYYFDIQGDISGSSSGGTLSFFLKFGPTRFVQVDAAMPASPFTGRGFKLVGMVTFRSASQIYGSFELTGNPTIITTQLSGAAASVSTAAAGSFSVGAVWNTANTANIVAARNGFFKLVKA